MKIKIQNYRKVDDETLQGVAQILFEDIGLTVNGVKVIKAKSGNTFYAFPSEKYSDKETGEAKYRDHCAFYTKGTYSHFHESMSNAFKIFFSTKPPEQTPYYPTTPPPPPPLDDDLPF